MYYDDEARRFNFLSGFLLGAVLGTGLALLTVPQGRPGKSSLKADGRKALSRAVKQMRKQGRRGGGSGRAEMLRSAARRVTR